MALRTFAGGGTFAHLLGRSKAASGKARAEDDKDETDEQRRDRERREREDAKASSGETEKGDADDKDKESKASESKADREDEDMEEADDLRDEDEGEDGTDPDEVDERNRDGKRSKRAKASDDDDAADTRAAGRKAERARGAAIFASPAAALRPDLAAHLAFKTNLSTRAAVDTLAAMAAGEPDARAAARRRGLAGSMAREPNPDVGQEDQRPAQRRASLGDRVAALQKKIGAA